MHFILPTRVERPALLGSDEAVLAYNDIAAELARNDATRRISINHRFFKDPEVVEQLASMFYGKCGYCETPDRKDHEADHFRPLMNAADASGETSHVHYSWLAYDWGNLIYACAACRSNKENRFPVVGRRAPVLSTLDEARAGELYHLIDPTFDKPSEHLDFDRAGKCIARTERGSVTIGVLGLNRKQLLASRGGTIDLFLNGLEPVETREFRAAMRDSIGPQAPFAGAVHAVALRLARRLAHTLRVQPPKPAYLAMSLPELLKKAGRRRLIAAIDAIDEDLHPFGQAAVEGPRPVSIIKQLAPWRETPAISRITIQNFKAIEHLDLDFRVRRGKSSGASCLMLLGENATGKSSILEAVALALLGHEQANKLGLRPSDFLRRDAQFQLVQARPARVRVEFFDQSEAAELEVSLGENRFRGTGGAYTVVGYGSRRYFTSAVTRRSNAPSARVRGLFHPRWVLPHPGKWLESLDQKRFDAAARALREIFSLRADDELVRHKQLGVCVRAGGQLTPIDRLSEGYKSLFAMSVDVMRKLLETADNLEEARGVALIDEVETHLHPRWKMRVMSALRQSMPRVQFLATTHDPLCLRGLDDGEVAVMVRDANHTISRLTDLPNVKGLRAEQLLTSDYFGLSSTADADVTADVARLADLVQAGDASSQDEIGRLSRSLDETLFLGETPAQQVAAEAMKTYLARRRDAAPEARSEAKRDAVSAFLAAIDESGGT